MSDRILYSSDVLSGAASEMNRLADILNAVNSDLSHVNTSEGWWSKLQMRSGSALNQLNNARANSKKLHDEVERINAGIRKTQQLFDDADAKVVGTAAGMATGSKFEKINDADGAAGGEAVDAAAAGQDQKKLKLWEEFRKELGFDGVLPFFDLRKIFKKAGTLGGLYKAFGDFFDPKSNFGAKGKAVSDGAKALVDLYDKITKATGGTFPEKLSGWWKDGGAKDLFGLSTKTLDKFKPSEFFGDYTGANGAGKAVCSWGSVAFLGVDKAIKNYQEFKQSDGKMSVQRAIGETLIETGVDFALTKGSEWAVGAAVAAVFGGAPAIVVGAGAAAVVAGVNAFCKWQFGKSASEAAADYIIDEAPKLINNAAKAAGDALGKTAKVVGKTAEKLGRGLCKWASKLSFAI